MSRNQHELVREAIAKQHNMVRRSKWSHRTVSAKLDPDWDYDSIVVHHSGNHGHKLPTEIESMHRDRNGYDDVGYHYMVHPGGTIYEGRSICFKGAHVDDANTHRIGILMMGDYNQQWWDVDDELTGHHLDNLRRLIRTLQMHFPGVRYLGGHLEFAKVQGDERSCPGNQLMKVMPDLRKRAGLVAPPKP